MKINYLVLGLLLGTMDIKAHKIVQRSKDSDEDKALSAINAAIDSELGEDAAKIEPDKALAAVDQADATKTASVEMQAPLDGIYSYKSNGLPNDFIYFDDVTDAKIIDWYKATTETSDLDVFFTWEIFGVEEVDVITEGGE